MNEGDVVLVKSMDGSPELEGTIMRVWNEGFARVLVLQTKADGLVHHDHLDMPVGSAVDGYSCFAVPVASAPSNPAPVSTNVVADTPEGGE